MKLKITGPTRFKVRATVSRWPDNARPTDGRFLANAASALLDEADQAFAELTLARAALAVALTPPGEPIPASGPFAKFVGRTVRVRTAPHERTAPHGYTGVMRAATDAAVWIGDDDGEYVPTAFITSVTDLTDLEEQ